jgi:hypothetical protein
VTVFVVLDGGLAAELNGHSLLIRADYSAAPGQAVDMKIMLDHLCAIRGHISATLPFIDL